ncbi:MAG: tryptophan--tRNA ligase [Candidatus Magasanikbacteria bacterium RIFCSPLOWO2_02_FULL_44_11]|uniref:Tryptophan--tRNA ligase n=1 Tax=Candidatus Magasanikbacteria bacterium RIFCSPLOWO2_02_FULL_44_11 TaxID=1798689 RepID=A0A1F6NBR5_9BACT|nr:MAG: tryptophan--tRNA ligase [Candidatus Magasanikbacteria bacterium RIFCSPLOWO2_02_FULL_44_11]
MSKPVIISGIQPTGNLHIGNYLGAVKKWVELQNSGKYDLYIFVADLHALTGNQTADNRRHQILVAAAELIAAGIDPKKTTLFIQSHIPEHAELAWIFNTVTPVAELYRMTQFKDKSVNQDKNINTGLLTYPVLQAADVLLYKATQVPVGLDQVQHLELTRDIARWFNNRYGEFFPEVKPLLTNVPKVMSLLEPTKKMSKSLGQGQVIEMADDPDTILKKLKKAITATEGGAKAPGAQNLLLLLEHFGGSNYQDFAKAEKAGTIQYGDLKQALAEAIADTFAAFRVRRQKLLDNETDELAAILKTGGAKARRAAEKTIAEVRTLVGLR